VRVDGDESATADAQTFASLEGLTSPGAPVAADAISSIGGDVIAEAPPGGVGALASLPGAKVLVVSGDGSAAPDAAGLPLAGAIVAGVRAADAAAIASRDGVLAVLAEDSALAAPSVDDIFHALKSDWLVRTEAPGSIDRVMIGTVSSDAASPYFGQRERTCVITRYDKTDIQLAALLTDIELMVLTGGGTPSPYLLDRIVGHRDDVSLLLAEENTVDAMRAIEPLYGRSRFSGAGKLARAVQLLDDAGVAVDF
jgi:hypothetical protein